MKYVIFNSTHFISMIVTSAVNNKIIAYVLDLNNALHIFHFSYRFYHFFFYIIT
jgi:hypothetical protein